MKGPPPDAAQIHEMLRGLSPKIVKGLLTHLYPEFDYSAHAFEVEQVTPSADNIKMLFKLFANDERGEGG